MEQQTENLKINGREDEIEIDIMDLLYYYRSKWIVLLASFLIGAILAGTYTYFFVTPKYTATSKLYMVSSSSDSVVDLADLNIGTSLSPDYVELLKIRPIFEEIIKEKGYHYTYEQLLGMTRISTISDTRILTVSVISTSPEEAQEISNALADKAVTYLPRLMDTSEPHIAERAILPKHKSSPSYSKNTVIGGLAVMFLAFAIFTVIYITDDTLNSAEDVEKVFGIIPLTVIPEGEMAASISVYGEKTSKKKKRWMKRKKK